MKSCLIKLSCRHHFWISQPPFPSDSFSSSSSTKERTTPCHPPRVMHGHPCLPRRWLQPSGQSQHSQDSSCLPSLCSDEPAEAPPRGAGTAPAAKGRHSTSTGRPIGTGDNVGKNVKQLGTYELKHWSGFGCYLKGCIGEAMRHVSVGWGCSVSGLGMRCAACRPVVK